MSFIDNVRNTTGKIGDIIKRTYGPLAALEQTYTPGNYRYPLDVGNEQTYPHTVEFQTWLPDQVSISDLGINQSSSSGNKFTSFTAPKSVEELKKTTKELEKKIGDYASKVLTPVKTEEWTENGMKITRNKQYNDRLLDFTRRATISDCITMYMPQTSWQDMVSNEYQQQSMTAALGTAGAVLDAAGSIIKEADFWSNEGGEGFWSKAIDALNGPQGTELVGGMASKFGLDGGVIRDAGLTALGYALNPQFEMLYQGTGMREFQFEFTMTPRSENEAKTIRDIVQRFKYHASPAYVQGQGRYIIPPSYFDITFKFNGSDSKWLPQISTCVLKQVSIDYGGGLEQWATHADGSPIQTKMVLIFVELEMIHKRLRDQGMNY